MGTKDTKAKEYLSDNERFADLCNVVLFHGEQVKEAAKLHKDDKVPGTKAEFLSGFHQDDNLTPVITITVYLGAKQWNGPRRLSDMWRKTDERVQSLISDYKINLVVPQEINDFEKFQTSLGEVLEMIKVSEDKQAMKKLMTENPRFMAMDNELVLAINTFIGANIPINKEGGVTNMCKAFENIRNEDIEQGRALEIYNSVQDGDYSTARGAQKLGISVDVFEKRMLDAGDKIPVM